MLLSCLCFAEDIGTARIPINGTFSGVQIAAGTYNFQIVEEQNGAYIQIRKGDQIVAKDQAIVIPARETVAKPKIEITKPDGRNFLRIRIRSGENWYFAYIQLK